MNKRTYKKISERENKAALIAKLIKFGNGVLSKKQLEQIANFKANIVFNEGTSREKRFVYKIANENCYVKYITDSKEFASIIYNGRKGFEHSWAGEEIDVVQFNKIIGNVKFGLHNEVDYSDNGNFIPAQIEHEEPDFTLSDLIVVYEYGHSWSNYNNNNYDEYTDRILVYNGRKGEYKVDEEIQYILDNFDI